MLIKHRTALVRGESDKMWYTDFFEVTVYNGLKPQQAIAELEAIYNSAKITQQGNRIIVTIEYDVSIETLILTISGKSGRIVYEELIIRGYDC